MMPVVDGMVFVSEFGEKGTERCGRGWREAVFPAEVNIKPGPIVVVQTEGLGYMHLVQAPLETSS
jgi:hypothetical protein